MPIVPLSARSNPASSRSSVVLPLPDGPRMAVRDPVGTSRSRPVRIGCAPNVLPRPLTVTSRMLSSFRLRRTLEEPPQQVAWYGRDHHHDEGERRGLAVGQVGLVGPELR